MKAMRLPFGNNIAVVHHSEAEFLDGLLNCNRPIVDASFEGSKERVSKTAGIKIGNLSLSTQQSSLAHFKTETDPQLTFILPFAGHGKISEKAKVTSWQSNGEFMSVSYHERMETDQISTTIAISPQLQDVFGGYQKHTAGFNGLLETLLSSGVTLFTSKSCRYNYFQMLMKLIAVVDSCGSDEVYLKRIGIDGLFEGILAKAVLDVGANRFGLKKILSELEGNRAVDLICSFVQHNIGSPLTIAAMKTMTGLPSNELNVAFQKRFECSPIEWQRNFLLDHSRTHLEKGGEFSSVEVLSRELGFISSRSFLYWYKKRFGVDAMSNLEMQVKSAPSQLN